MLCNRTVGFIGSVTSPEAKVKPLLLFVMLSVSMAAQAGPNHHHEIISALYNAEIARADSLINASIQAHPELPDYYFLKAHHAFYSRYFSPQPLSRDSMLVIIEENSRKAVELAEKDPDVGQNRFYLGSAYGLLSRVHVMRQELWDGYWTARKSRNSLGDLLKEDSTFCDAFVGLGVIEYYPSRLTGIQAALSWLAGMAGDGDKGIEYFRKASAKGNLLRAEATLILGFVARTYDNDYGRAGELFGALHEQYPGNAYFLTQSLQANLGVRIESEGSGFLRENVESARTEYRINTSGVLNSMAYTFMGRGDNATALELFGVNIELYPDEANPHDSIAECYVNLGKKDEAIRHSRIALEKLPGDTTIDEEFRENLREILRDRLKELGAEPGV
jgi:tetratricopeptide (TPR) repeat protein